jgi:hypothetical protein
VSRKINDVTSRRSTSWTDPVTVARAITRAEALSLAAELVMMFDPAHMQKVLVDMPNRLENQASAIDYLQEESSELREKLKKFVSVARLALRWAVSDQANADLLEAGLTPDEFDRQQDARITILQDALNS